MTTLTGIGQNQGVATTDSTGKLTAALLPTNVPTTDNANLQTFSGPIASAAGMKYAGRDVIADYDQYMSNPDANGIYTTVTLKRPDGTVYLTSVLSNPDANGNYQTDTWSFYEGDGTTVGYTHVWSITYDSNNKMTQKVMTS